MTLDVTVTLDDLAATMDFAQRLAAILLPRDVVGLSGPLGSGKTALARGIIRALTSPQEEVPSPTFTLVQGYDSAKGSLFHFDLYRLDDAGQAMELGLDDAFAEGISLIEWPERLGDLLPRRHLRITIAGGPTAASRLVRLTGEEPWTRRWT